MSAGGKRWGSGRPLGSVTRKTREVADRAAEEGVTPMEYMLAVMKDESAEPDRRDRMAMAAAPFMHPRISTVALRGEPDAEPVVVTLKFDGPDLSGRGAIEGEHCR